MAFDSGRRKSDAISLLQSGEWQCASCKETHTWPFDLAASTPDVWPGEVTYEHNGALRMEGNFLSEDFCVLEGQHFMIRAVLLVPVIGLKDSFGFGCWTTLSRANFEKYVAGFDSGIYPDMGPWSGWLMNRLKGFNDEPEPLAVNVQPRLERMRPCLWVVDDLHPLAKAQDGGITPERMLEVFANDGHLPE